MLNLQVTPLRLQGWSEDLLFIRHLQELAKSDLVLLHALRTIRGHHIITEKRRLRRTLCRAMSASTMVKTSKIMLRLAQAIIFFVPANTWHIEEKPYDTPCKQFLTRGPDNIVVNMEQ